jgi:hypothetical protein
MSRSFTQVQVVAWLSCVQADSDISANDFRIAFALSQAADTEGFISRVALSKCAQINGVGDLKDLYDALGRLTARQHLEPAANKRKIEGLQMLAPAAKAKSVRRPKVVPFPAARRSAFIHKHAVLMAKSSQAKADAHLRQQLQIQAETMRRKGIADDVIGAELRRLEAAIKNELWTCILLPEKPA